MKVDAIQVVVVDGVRDFVDALAAMLRLRGCVVRTACTAEDALALIEEYQPHCVLFDVVMQGMGGDELCQCLRARHGDDIVLIAMSGASKEDRRVRSTFALADHFFTKPVDPAAIASILAPLQ